MKIDDLVRLMRPLATRVANTVARAVVTAVNDAPQVQEIQIEVLDGEVRSEVERFQNYGFTSRPLAGAEAAVVFVGGRREHGMAIAVEDRRYRVKDLEPGEVAVFTNEGDRVVIRKGGTIEITASTKVKVTTPLLEVAASTKMKVTAPSVEVVGDLSVSGTITAPTVNADNVTATTDVVGGGVHLKTHAHLAGTLLISAAAGAPVTGKTDAPA